MPVLNFWIPPFTDGMIHRSLVSHKGRGLAWHMTGQMATGKLAPSTLDLTFCLGAHKRLPVFRLRHELYPLARGNAQRILHLLATYATATSLADVNLHWIDLEFRQLTTFQQDMAIEVATKVLNRPSGLSFAERHTHMKPTDQVPPDVLRRLEMSIASLEAALLEKDPMMPQHLRNSHSILTSYPETVQLLEDKEIALFIDAAEIHTKTEIVKAAAKGGAGSGTRKKITATDL